MRLLIDTHEIHLDRTPTGARFSLDQAPARDADIRTIEPGLYSILLDGRSYEARVEEHGDGLLVVIDGRRFELDVRDPRQWNRHGRGAGGQGRQNIVSPMPGKVVKVLVAVGDEVTAGQGLIVVEAMKMQNEMKAPKDGRVATLPVQEGATVAAGETLASIE